MVQIVVLATEVFYLFVIFSHDTDYNSEKEGLTVSLGKISIFSRKVF